MYHQYNYIERGRVSGTLWRPHFYDVLCVFSYFYVYFLFSYIHTYRHIYIYTYLEPPKMPRKILSMEDQGFLFTYILLCIYINHPQVITMFMGGMFTIPSHG